MMKKRTAQAARFVFKKMVTSELPTPLIHVIAAITLLLSQWLFLRGTSNVLPLEFWDEAVYIRGTFDLPLPQSGWGPAYVYWYAALKAILVDPIKIFHVNAIVVTALLSWVTFLWLVRLRAHPLMALAGGLWVLLWKINFPVMPKINHFNASVLLLWSLIASLIPGRLGSKCLVLSSLLLPLAYLRQENLLVAAVIFFYAVIWFRRKRTFPSITTITLTALFSIASLYCFTTYSPFDNRGWPAFVDHYLFSAERSGGPFTRPVIENEIFRGAGSIGEAAWKNPLAFSAYAWKNYWQLLTVALPKSILLHYTIPSYAPALVLLGCLFLKLLLRRTILLPIGHGSCHPILRVVAVALIFKSLVIVGLMEAVPRYFLDTLIFSIVFLLAALSPRHGSRIRAVSVIAAAAGVLAFTPNVTSPHVRASAGEGGGTGFREAVDFLNRELKPSDRVFGQPAYTTYTPYKVESCELHCNHYTEKLQHHFEISDFLAVLGKEAVNWIVVDRSLTWKLSERLPGGPNYTILDGLDSSSCVRLVFSNKNAKIYRTEKNCLAAGNGAAAMD